MKKYTTYEIKIAFEQYKERHEVVYRAAAEGIEYVRDSALKRFWGDYGGLPNLRIHHITITEYN